MARPVGYKEMKNYGGMLDKDSNVELIVRNLPLRLFYYNNYLRETLEIACSSYFTTIKGAELYIYSVNENVYGTSNTFLDKKRLKPFDQTKYVRIKD